MARPAPWRSVATLGGWSAAHTPSFADRGRCRVGLIAPARDVRVRSAAGRLISDSRQERELAGVRGPAGDDDRYQLTFLAQDVDVILDVAPRPDHHLTLRGQVLPPSGVLPVFEAAVQWPGGTLRTILGDDLGGFDLYGVPVTAHTLQVTNDDLTVRMSLDLSDWP